MSTFTQQVNPITGKCEWNLQAEDYDYKQEVARSAFADMLHDSERNEKYFDALKICVKHLRSQKKEIHCLDIGTGTGLLSMMALSLDVDSVTACETFTPMAECAIKILKLNGYENKMKLIGKRSTEMEAGPGKDMPRRANLLITEVFDTELIGEGAIETFRHAKENLLTTDALIVPSTGTIYAQVVSSKLLRNCNKMNTIVHNDSQNILLTVPSSILQCPGSSAVHDLQMSEIPSDAFVPIGEPQTIFTFDWTGRNIDLENDRMSKNNFNALNTGDCDCLFMWWDLNMDPFGKVLLSCAPKWYHPITKGKIECDNSMIPWRDHWMQGIYYFPQQVHVKKGEQISLISNHDEYSLWFNLNTNEGENRKPVCNCGIHLTHSRTRIGQLNDPRRRNFYINILEKHVNAESICLMLGSFSYLGIVAANLGAKHVYLHEPNRISADILQKFIKDNGVEKHVTILRSELSKVSLSELNFTQATIVFSEPNFTTAMLPWDSLQFLYLMDEGRHLISFDATILPSQLTIYAIPVEFRDLWKIRAPLGKCCGFDLTIFDDLIDTASDEADESVEPQPLWEYPTKAVGHPKPILTVPLDKGICKSTIFQDTDLPVLRGTLNGVALWADWHFGDSTISSTFTTGPTADIKISENISWDMYTRQGISLIKEHKVKTPEHDLGIHFKTKFYPEKGSVTFDFNVTC